MAVNSRRGRGGGGGGEEGGGRIDRQRGFSNRVGPTQTLVIQDPDLKDLFSLGIQRRDWIPDRLICPDRISGFAAHGLGNLDATHHSITFPMFRGTTLRAHTA